MRQTVLTLRARDQAPAIGDYVRAPNGLTVYRILQTVHVRRAGAPDCRVRLVCARVAGDAVPAGANVLPWPQARQAPPRRAQVAIRATADPGPPETHAERVARIRAKAPVLWALQEQAAREQRARAAAEQLTRARRVGRDHGVVGNVDCGHGIRLQAIRSAAGVLRAPDVEVGNEADPGRPNRTLRRARRVDPLVVLWRAGSIDARAMDAGMRLRGDVEGAQPPVPGVARSEVHVSPFQRLAITDRHVDCCTAVRRATAALRSPVRAVVLWVCLGGSISGYEAYARIRKGTAAPRLRDGLGALADHYGLPTKAAA